MWLAKILLFFVVAYVGLAAALYLAQTRLIFPNWLVPAGGPMPASMTPLDATAPDGVALKGVRIAGSTDGGDGGVVILGFGGNAWDARSLAGFLHELYPGAEIAAFYYRGYRPSGGDPSAAALLADAPVVHDVVAARALGKRIVAVGISLGTGVAAHLARHRPLAGLILVSPFDSLAALGREHYPWLPVRWLLRHHMRPADDLRGLTLPVALITAANDTIVSPRRSEPVRRAAANLVLDQAIPGVGHNDMFAHPDFRAAMREALARLQR